MAAGAIGTGNGTVSWDGGAGAWQGLLPHQGATAALRTPLLLLLLLLLWQHPGWRLLRPGVALPTLPTLLLPQLLLLLPRLPLLDLILQRP